MCWEYSCDICFCYSKSVELQPGPGVACKRKEIITGSCNRELLPGGRLYINNLELVREMVFFFYKEKRIIPWDLSDCTTSPKELEGRGGGRERGWGGGGGGGQETCWWLKQTSVDSINAGIRGHATPRAILKFSSGFERLQKLKNPGFSRAVLPIFPGLFQGSWKSRMKTTFTTNCNHIKKQCAPSVVIQY